MSKMFWKCKDLHEFTSVEWESLCDGCGKCCLHKLEDDESGEVYYTDVACKCLNLKTAQCNDYGNRLSNVPECLDLTPGSIQNMPWLPDSCAYKLIFEGKNLPGWHPLMTNSVRKSFSKMKRKGITVVGQAVSELQVHPDEVQERVVYWV